MKDFGRGQITWLFALTIALLASTVSFGATFPGSGTGQIPDSPAGGNLCGDYTGAPLNVTFAVSGLTAPLSDVRVSFTSSGLSHSWVGDLDVTLRAPADAAVKTIFKQTLGTTATACGDDSDVGGPYNFFDTGANNWYTAATTAGSAVAVASGDYQAVTPGGAAGGGVNSPILPTFVGLSTGQINGTWTLRVHDGGQGDTGAISAATLTLTGAVGNSQHIVDMNGDNKTDWVVVRNTGGGPTGQVTWFTAYNGVAGGQTDPWGIATDFFVPGNYDADTKTDVAIWRPGSPGSAAWYILQSATSTLRAETFGQSGDDPTVQGDYNGDGLEDIAVYRAGAASGDPSFWHYRTAVAGPITTVGWGQNGDFVAPGDYDGDNKNDFVIQRNAGGGQARFWRLFATGSSDSLVFGTPTDVVVPGDYDADNKTDIATIRGISGQIYWFVLPSSGGAYTNTPWGNSATDFPTQGDYDGDGKTDYAIWRPNADPTQNFFYVLQSSNGALNTFEWGQNGDYPVANYNSH